MHPDGRAEYWVALESDMEPRPTGPIHGPAFRWETLFGSPRDKWEPVDVPIEPLSIWAMSYEYGSYSRFQDDLYWRADKTWGGPGTSWYVGHFSPDWFWIRSDGVLLATSPGSEVFNRHPQRDAYKLLIASAPQIEPIVATPQRELVKEKLHAIGVEIP